MKFLKGTNKDPQLTAGPDSPEGPFSPAGPGGPTIPCSPGGPPGPESPRGPRGPSLPEGPAGPGGPTIPWEDKSESVYAIHIVYIYRYSFKKPKDAHVIQCVQHGFSQGI